ncbi:MAG: response regulator, partial [Candidatus Latescibacteria bacterium]|nr:response regulator [Candidatus Latescibacterota bacterium]
FEASNGKEGLEKVKEVNPDLLILDVMMDSDTEGFQVSYKLKTPEPEYAAYAKLPILMVTAIGKMKGMQFSPKKDEGFLPVDDFVEKPIQPRVLLEKVKTLIGN